MNTDADHLAPAFRNEAIRAQWPATALESANTVYLLGYSIPEGDSLVRTFLAASSSVKKLIPVDIETTGAERLRELKRHEVDERFIRAANPIPVFGVGPGIELEPLMRLMEPAGARGLRGWILAGETERGLDLVTRLSNALTSHGVACQLVDCPNDLYSDHAMRLVGSA